jgi:hypothetical protein
MMLVRRKLTSRSAVYKRNSILGAKKLSAPSGPGTTTNDPQMPRARPGFLRNCDVSVCVQSACFSRRCQTIHCPEERRIARHCKQRRELDWCQGFIAMMPTAELDASAGHTLTFLRFEHQWGGLRAIRVNCCHMRSQWLDGTCLLLDSPSAFGLTASPPCFLRQWAERTAQVSSVWSRRREMRGRSNL